MSEFQANVVVVGQVIQLSGQICFDNAPRLQKEVQYCLQRKNENSEQDSLKMRTWTIDWSGVTEVESIALPLLLTWLSFSKKHGKVLRCVHLPQILFALAKSCGLSEHIVKWID